MRWLRLLKKRGVVSAVAAGVVALGAFAIARNVPWLLLVLVLPAIWVFEAVLRQAGISGLFVWERNDSFEAAQKQITGLFNRARWEVRMITGSLLADLYDKPPVSDAIERALARGVQLNIVVVGDRVDPAVFEPNHWGQAGVAEGKVNLWHVPAENVPHVIMVDGVHVRLEDMRDHYSGATRRSALCRYHGPRQVEQANFFFEKLRDKAVHKTAGQSTQEVA